MRYGQRSTRQRPHDTASSSRAPSGARVDRALAARYQLNPKTVAKWRHRTTTADAPMGPRVRRSIVLSPLEEAAVVAFRRRTMLPLDDVLGRLREALPQLSRSALHRCLQRHDISRLPLGPERASRRGTLRRPVSATSTSMPASCAPPRASCTCSWPSIGSRSSPTSGPASRTSPATGTARRRSGAATRSPSQGLGDAWARELAPLA
jgi:hypothetical protein